MNFAVVVAAGRGSRAGGAQSKQFREISGIPIIIHTLSRFERCETIEGSVVVLPRGDVDGFAALAARYGLGKVLRAVGGGETRAESVMRGLESLKDSDVGVVAVHDGVRPFVTPEEIDRTVREAERAGAAILAVPVTDTIKEAEAAVKEAGGVRVLRTLERARLWRAQTPQCFRFELLRRAYEQTLPGLLDATDDSALVERLGASVSIVEGGEHNIKITTPHDFAVAELLLREVRG
jgi:2-C-methyl-D-erythritol 4-phosphate cytidylyltransferase